MTDESKTAIIIDDESDIREIIHHYCNQMGIFRSIVTAEDGIMALSKLSKQRFDVIFLDLKMPRKTGLDVVREFKKQSFNDNLTSNIVVVSAFINKDLMQKLMTLGIKHFITKPLNQERLEEQVNKVLAQAEKAAS